MTMHQVLMAVGESSVTLRPTAKHSLRMAPVLRDHIVITPTRLDDPNVDAETLYSLARHTFRIDEITDRLTFAGPSLMVWLGDGDTPSKGGWTSPAVVGAIVPKTFSQFVAASLPVNNISEGTAYSSSATSMYETMTDTETPREAFLRMHNLTGVEYRVNPDLTFDWGAPGSLWKSGANITLLLSKDHDGVDLDGLVGLRVVGRFSTTESGSEFANKFRSQSDDGSLSSTATVSNCTDALGVDYAIIAKFAEVNTAEQDDVDARRVEMANQYVDTFEVSCSVDCFDFGQYLTKGQPGDFVYLYDPDTLLINRSNQKAFGGEVVFPISTHRILEFTAPIQRGMGVYHVASNDTGGLGPASMTVTDWSDDFEPDMQPAQLVLGKTPPLTLAKGINGNN